MSGSITMITTEEYERLLEDSQFLECCQACGLDNWEGIEEAMAMFNEDGLET